jgi:hypothetical protein
VYAQQGRFKFSVTIPKQVAGYASERAAGNTQAPPPVLMLQGLETGANESLNIRVLDESGSVMAVTGLVGTPDATEQSAPLQKVNLPVPLNDHAARLLAGKNQVNLVLEIENNNKIPRKGLKIDRIFFQAPESH